MQPPLPHNHARYDSLNRITGALTTSTHATSPTHCWGETYNVDAWGNLNSIAPTTNSNYTGCTEESGFSTTADGNNHLPLFYYDASGNTSNDGVVTNYQWNAESELKSAAGINYLYDGDGRRVSKSNGSVSKLFWYDSGGDILSETDGSGNMTHEYIFFGGKRIAFTDGTSPAYYIEDMLGTSRVMTWSNGTLCYDADFYPYGGERAYTNACQQEYKFEGKDRDPETGNDNFDARYYSNRMGRWLSADWSSVPVPVPYANLTNPQTLNLYAMVSDDPESFGDLDGHGCELNLGTGGGISCPNLLAIAGEGAKPNTANNGTNVPNPTTEEQQAAIQSDQRNEQNQNDQSGAKPQPKNQPYDPVPTDPNGKPTPPPVPVPGCPECRWVWSPDAQNGRGGRWVSDKPPAVPGETPGGSWDTGSRGGPGHWDVDDGKGNRRKYYPDGRQMPDIIAHPPGWRPIWFTSRNVAIGAGTVAAGYLIYRAIRMVPSLVIPPLWPTIPLNVALP